MARESPLPDVWRGLEGKVRCVQQQSATVFTASCPSCGGDYHANGEPSDRFIFWVEYDGDKLIANGSCRQCGYKVWADELDDSLSKPSPEDRARWEAKAATYQAQQMRRAQRALDHIERMREQRLHELYNANVAGSAKAQAYWARRGLDMKWVDFWQLGYCEHKEWWTRQTGPFRCNSATIPIFGPDWDLLNIRHRLIDAPDTVGKYRPEVATGQSYIFRTDPSHPLTGDVIVVEGELKAAVLHSRLQSPELGIVGIPGVTPGDEMVTETLANAKRLTLIFDPGSRQPAWELCKKLGISRCRVLIPPMKIDDGIVAARFDKGKLERMIANAKPAGRVT